MKKSLLITSTFPPQVGGMEDYLYNIAKRLPKDKVVVLAPTRSISGEKVDSYKFDKEQNFKIYRRRFFFPRFIKPGWLPLLWNCLKIVKEEKIEFIQSGQCYPTGLAGLYIKERLNIPYLVYVHGLDLIGFATNKLGFATNKLRRKGIKAILKNACKIVVNSQNTKKLVLEWGDYFEKIKIINPALDLKKYPQVNEKEAKAKLNLGEKKIILSVGRLIERKGFDMVIRSLPEICKKFPDLIYLVVGSGPDRERLESLIRKLGLEDRVKLVGRVKNKDLPFYYAASDLFCMPSRYIREGGSIEGFGIVYLEANLYGKPVIGGKTGGVEDAIKDGETGLLVNPENKEEITQAIIRLLTNKELSNKLGVQGRKRVLKDFDWDKRIKEIESLLS